MAKYDVVKRFQEVAKRASPKLQTDRTVKTPHKFEDEQSASDVVNYATRPGRSMNIGRGRYGEKKDVNLPIETASSEVKKRLYGKK